MDSRMILWECTYKVERHDATVFYVKDWVWSTTEPVNSIGHYWSELFSYNISDKHVYAAPAGVDCSRYQLSDSPF